jgi:hypothetical protein
MEKHFEWIMKIISSSTDHFHYEGCDNLIELFAKKYGKECEDELNKLLSALLIKRQPFNL